MSTNLAVPAARCAAGIVCWGLLLLLGGCSAPGALGPPQASATSVEESRQAPLSVPPRTFARSEATDEATTATLKPVGFEEPEAAPEPLVVDSAARIAASSDDGSDAPLPPVTRPEEDIYQIDLTTALRLAGANNLQIEIAAERIQEAYARLAGARALWIPSINAGVGYNKHDGRIQETEGAILEVSRGSLFAGGGALLSGAPLTGGSGGPARFFVDISPVDIYFEPLAARQLANAAHAEHVVTFNDTLLEVAVAYLELQRRQWLVAVAEEAVKNADELVRLTETFAKEGTGLEADAARARADRADRRQQLLEAQERVRVVSAELARLLRLDSQVTLFAVEHAPAPIALIEEDLSLPELVEQALSTRPELSRHQALVAETVQRMRQEQLRPWLPNVHLGASAGGYGGGEGSHLGRFSGRSDFDVLAVWELRNLGYGNRALQRERESRHRQAYLAYEQTVERIAAEVAQAFQQVRFRKGQIEQARLQVESAQAALPLNFEGIRGGELRAIEAQQAIAALAEARQRYLQAVIAYNQAQFGLLRALGEAPATDSSSSLPADALPAGDSLPPAPGDVQ